MRKKLHLLLILLISIFYKSQDNSISASVNTPVSYQTGVPDISFPLVSLPANKELSLNFSLSYNPNSYKMGEFCGQIARNWSLAGSNFMITRKIVGSYPDENTPATWEWDDIYYYNLNGEQGSFRFERTGTLPSNYVYKLIKLTTDNVIIEPIRGQLNNYYPWPVLQSFIMKDSRGYKYYFQDHDSQQFVNINNPVEMTSAFVTFYITKIQDPGGQEIATFQNKKYSISDTGNGVYTYMPEIITTKYGKITVEHGDSGASWNFNDRYYFKSFTLWDQKNNFISKKFLDISDKSYQFFDLEMFQTTENVTVKTRSLKNIKKYDKSSNVIEKISFGYNSLNHKKYGSGKWWGDDLAHLGIFKNDNPNFLLYDLLNTVILPSGGKINYDFGANHLKSTVDRNTVSYIQDMKDPISFGVPDIQYLKKTDSIEFDSKVKKIYNLTKLKGSPNSRIYIRFIRNEIYPWESDPTNPTLGPTLPPKLSYKVKNAISIINSGPPVDNNEIETEYSSYKYVVPSNGSASIEILGSGGKGEFWIYEKAYSDPPYTNQIPLSNSGVRIEKIKYSDNSQNTKTLEFDYSSFNEPGVSSGVAVPDDYKETIIYKNVKVTESDKPGYTKYYYKTPYDFPTYPHPTIPNTSIWPNFNLTKKGILDKKEVYDAANIKRYSTVSGYILPNYDLSKLYKNEVVCIVCDMGGMDPFYTQESFPEKTTSTDISYDSSGNTLTNTSEQTFDQVSKNLMSEKKTSADGTVSETIYQYAADKNNTKLLGVGMLSVPLEVTQKRNNIQVGKLETKYDQTGNYFPSSVTSFGINNVITGEQTNEYYDDMGNVLQTRSKSGMTTAVIWGYNRTQPIAKIEGGEYFNILSLMGQTDANLLDIVQKSNLDVDSSNDANEQLLRNALEAFRKKPEFKNYLITTYTYDPLIGVKSVTSPNGMTEYYFYDNQNRMIRVEDANHNVIKENKYLQNVYQN